MNILALDIGKRRTGAALADDANGVVVALDTIAHASVTELIARIQETVKTKRIGKLVLGLPLLPSGDEGEQALFVRSVGQDLQKMGFLVQYIDERYSTPSLRQAEHREIDADSASACQILHMYLDRSSNVDNI